jgi:hypothetical protein
MTESEGRLRMTGAKGSLRMTESESPITESESPIAEVKKCHILTGTPFSLRYFLASGMVISPK